MNYKLILPPNYIPPPLPGRDEICQELRTTTCGQERSRLGTPNGPKCCLGVISHLQGRLDSNGDDGPMGNKIYLDDGNPLFNAFSNPGYFPGVVNVDTEIEIYESLADLNDHWFSFPEIADIIEQVWSNAPKNW